METSTDTTDIGLSFAYDASGLRTEKTVVTKTYEMVHTHDYTATVIQPTCTEGGYTLHECDCGDSYQDNETDPLGHDYVESGVDTYTCTRCGSSYTTHTHSYTATVVEPTCTERGYTLYECACGHSYQSNFTDALDHDYVKVREDYRYYYYECTRCGKTYRSPIYHIPVEPKPPIAVAGLTPETETNGSQQVLVSTVTEEHSYIYASGMLLRETITSGNTTKTLDFRYDNVGYPYALIYNNGSTTATYYYITNLQGDVMYLVDGNGIQVAAYTYDPYGKILSAYGSMAEINPLRYRGYYYDAETGFYYLQSRYYDPNTCRFINADGYASTGQGYLGHNMFAYCNNDPINKVDPTGESLIAAVLITAVAVVCAVTLSGCSSQPASTGPRSDLASAPDLDVNTASPGTYNCYGNGIGKQINTNPTGYTRGDSTRKTFEAVKQDLGIDNVRELTSIDDPIGEDEFKVAMKCGPTDYHFIRLDENGWYNKSGTTIGLYIDQSMVSGDVWYAIWLNNGQAYIGDPRYGYPCYNDETIYFAVKIGRDAQ